MIRLRFRLRPRLGCSWAPLGAPLAPFLDSKLGPDRPRCRPRSASKMGPKIKQKRYQNGRLELRSKFSFSGQNGLQAHGLFWPGCSFLPLGLSSPLRWPKSQILTPTCLKVAPKTDPRATFRPQLAPKLRLNLSRGGGFRGIYY